MIRRIGFFLLVCGALWVGLRTPRSQELQEEGQLVVDTILSLLLDDDPIEMASVLSLIPADSFVSGHSWHYGKGYHISEAKSDSSLELQGLGEGYFLAIGVYRDDDLAVWYSFSEGQWFVNM